MKRRELTAMVRRLRDRLDYEGAEIRDGLVSVDENASAIRAHLSERLENESRQRLRNEAVIQSRLAYLERRLGLEADNDTHSRRV